MSAASYPRPPFSSDERFEAASGSSSGTLDTHCAYQWPYSPDASYDPAWPSSPLLLNAKYGSQADLPFNLSPHCHFDELDGQSHHAPKTDTNNTNNPFTATTIAPGTTTAVGLSPTSPSLLPVFNYPSPPSRHQLALSTAATAAATSTSDHAAGSGGQCGRDEESKEEVAAQPVNPKCNGKSTCSPACWERLINAVLDFYSSEQRRPNEAIFDRATPTAHYCDVDMHNSRGTKPPTAKTVQGKWAAIREHLNASRRAAEQVARGRDKSDSDVAGLKGQQLSHRRSIVGCTCKKFAADTLVAMCAVCAVCSRSSVLLAGKNVGCATSG